VIDLLHTIGAADSYVARQFARHVLTLSARGSFAGAAAGALTILAVDLAVPVPPSLRLPAAGPDLADWAALAAVPVLATALSALAARVTVLRALARLP
jgi:cell division transport system permease protein